MKILFTADLHIKLGQKNVPIDWAKNRYNLLIEQLAAIQDSADMLVLGGDIFDRIPTMDEIEIYFDLISSVKIPCVIYSGNHEALKRNTTFFSYLIKSTKKMNSLVTVIDDFVTINEIDFVPYNKLKELETTNFKFKHKILCTHVRGDIPPHVKAEIDLSIFDKWQVVLAGDLHNYENSQRNIIYPGSPVTTSFHRNSVDTGVIVLDTQTMEHAWVKLSLPQLIRKSVNVSEPMVSTDYHHTIYEVEGDMLELSSMEDSSLIDKKVVKKETDTALILEPNMSLAAELTEYLLYILQLPETTVESIVHVLNNNIDKIAVE